MTAWIETCQQQLVRLEKASVLSDKLLTLCDKAGLDTLPEIREKINDERKRLNRQLERLRVNRFEVAVIGLEKAGKSALLNAWLGQEILPSAAERCTYTTTEIWSAPTEDDQELNIEYYTRQEVDALLDAKRTELKKFVEGSRDYDDLMTDIHETEKLLDRIHGYTSRKPTTRRFRDIGEIAEDLQQAVFQNRAQARSIKRIQLKTTRLRSDRDIVFHDVPGFDSPVDMHKRQTQQRLAECDAIIYAKKMDNPNINSPEKNMLQIGDAEDPQIKVSGKVFVVLTKSDMARNRNEYEDWLEKHKRDWKDVPENRIVAVCAAAHISRLGTGSLTTNVSGQSSIESLEKLGIDDGIERLKKSVDFYIDNERSTILGKRCNAMVANIRQHADDIITKLNPLYGRITDSETQEDDLLDKDFNKWWGAEWIRIKKDFDTWYSETIKGRKDMDTLGSEHQELAELHMAYDKKIEELLSNLNTTKPEELKRIYTTGGTVPIPDPVEGNYKIRGELLHEVQKNFEMELTDQLTLSLQKLADQIVQKAKELLWHTSDVPSILIESEHPDIIQHGFRVLFLRFGRVVVETFIAKPLHAREQLLNEYQAEIRTIEAFYRGKDEAKKDGWLRRYFRYGASDVKVAADIGVVPPIVGNSAKLAAEKTQKKSSYIEDLLRYPGGSQSNSNVPFKPDSTGKPPEPRNFDEVINEINHDLQALEDYLKNSVFYAAGFVTYCHQELDRIRNRFFELEDQQRQWIGIIRTAIKYGRNRDIPFEIDSRRQDFRRNREIALELKEVRDICMTVN